MMRPVGSVRLSTTHSTLRWQQSQVRANTSSSPLGVSSGRNSVPMFVRRTYCASHEQHQAPSTWRSPGSNRGKNIIKTMKSSDFIPKSKTTLEPPSGVTTSDDPFVTYTFYKFVDLTKTVSDLRAKLEEEWRELEVVGRVAIATEGINGNVSLRKSKLEAFRQTFESKPELQGTFLNPGVKPEKGHIKLYLRERENILGDGLPRNSLNMENTACHLEPEEWNEKLDDPNAIIVDVRNNYESDIGYFEGAIKLKTETFRESLPVIRDMLKGHENTPVLMYCTGGIRCEKATSYLSEYGFRDLYQLNGGIVNYANTMREKNMPSKFKGINFCFDQRGGERITPDVVGVCYNCGEPSDVTINCNNLACHQIVVSCQTCTDELEGSCSAACQEVVEWGRAHPEQYEQMRRDIGGGVHKGRRGYTSYGSTTTKKEEASLNP